MSDPGTAPKEAVANTTLEHVRKHAKRQLRRARAGEPQLLAILRSVLPRLAACSDKELASQLKLSDIHHALAREHGLKSWSELKRQLETLDPIHVQAARFLEAIREAQLPRAQGLLERHPLLASYNLCCAVAAGNIDFAASWLQADSTRSAEPHPGDGWEPLLYACHSSLHKLGEPFASGSLRCVELLLDAGASPNATIASAASDEANPLPALYFACESDNVPVVRLLLERGANPNDGESIYHAPQRNHFACAELLLAHGADLNRKHEPWDNTPLYYMVGYFEGSPDTDSYLNAVRWLLEHGADPNLPSYQSQEVPLHRCATFNHGPELAELLLAYGARVDAERADRRTPYVLAVRSGNTRLAKFLLEKGADQGRLAPIDELLGAAMAGDAATAQHIAAKYPRLLDILSDDDRQSVANAAWLGHVPALRILAGLGFDLGSREGEAGGTALHAAAWHGNVAAVQTLLELGAPVNVRDRTYGSSPLAWAAHGSAHCKGAPDEDYCNVVRLLLDAGADRETSINRWGEAPESMASPAVAKLLRP